MNWSATAVGGGGVEVKPLSQEEALARLDEARQLGWFDPSWEDATIDAVRVAERYWRKYCDVVGGDYKEYLLRGDEAGRKAVRSIRVSGSGLASTTSYITPKKDGNILQQCLNSRVRVDHKVSVR